MKRTAILAALILFNVANASAGQPSPILKNIVTSAHKAKSGVIVAVTDRGDVAADTAWLLSAQVNRDSSYAPLLLTLKPEERQDALRTLNLSEASLPALIFYDHNGREISRVIGARPSPSIKQLRSSNSDALN